MMARGVTVPRSVFEEAEGIVSRYIAFDIARYVFDGEAEFRRRAAVDRPLQRALELAEGARTGQDLLRKAAAAAPRPDSLGIQ